MSAQCPVHGRSCTWAYGRRRCRCETCRAWKRETRRGEQARARARRQAAVVAAGMVPAATLVRVIDDWLARGHTLVELSAICGRDVGRSLCRLRQELEVSVYRADEFVSAIDPFLWLNDPELAAVYRAFDQEEGNDGDVHLDVDSHSARAPAARAAA